MVLWVTRTQYCLLTLYWQKLHPSLQEVGAARGMRDERSHWPQTWHRENILVFASINKLPLHCTCNTKVIESNMFALKRTYLYSLMFKMHVWTTLQNSICYLILGSQTGGSNVLGRWVRIIPAPLASNCDGLGEWWVVSGLSLMSLDSCPPRITPAQSSQPWHTV